MVEPPAGSAGFAAGLAEGIADFAGATGDWPNTMVAWGDSATGLGAGLPAAGVEGRRFPVWNIIVRPAPSSAGTAGGAAGLGGATGVVAADLGGATGVAAAGFAGDGNDGFGGATGCCANVMGLDAGSGTFARTGLAAGFGAGGTGGWSCTVGSGSGLVTLKVFWHFPQRMVRPCGPIRASSMR
jgi:hypothetical protein